jgi:hypothetical protein
MATARLLGRTTAGTGAAEEITVGAGLNMAAGVLAATGGGGSSYRLTTNTTPVGWVATTAAETDLMTYSLPAGTLAVNGQIARINMSGQGASSHSKTVKIYFGSAVLFTIGPSTTLTYWTVQVDVIRTGAATQVAQVNYHLSNSGGFAVAATAPAETLSGAITIKATGTSTSSSVTNEIMQNTLIVEILP